MEENENRTSRARFLRQVVLTLGAAVGAGALASHAFAQPGQCCKQESCGACTNHQMQSGHCCFCDCSGSGTGTPDYCWVPCEGEAHCRPTQDCIQCPC